MQSWAVNLPKRLRYAVSNPGYALRAVVRDLSRADERYLAGLTGAPLADIRAYLEEIFHEHRFRQHLVDSEAEIGSDEDKHATFFGRHLLYQYAIVRAARPERVVETGVANGVSSSCLLLAMEKNGVGSLVSVDIGDRSFLPPGRDIGWIAPDWLRHRWTLHLGDAREVLPGLLDELGEIDMFIHDSLHTYDHMLFEFQEAYPHIRPGGYLLSDDALWNTSFPEFARSVNSRTARVIRGLGVLRKPHDSP